MALSQEFEALLERREQLLEDTLDAFDDRLERFRENTARRLAAVLGVDPDEIYPERGNDGRLVGQTEFEQRLLLLEGTERIRAGVLAAELQEIEEFVDAAGMDKARETLRGGIAELAGLSEQRLDVQGVSGAIGALDTVSAEALLGNYLENLDETLRRTIDSRAALRIREGLSNNLGLMSIEDSVELIVAQEEISASAARTEANTRMAEADRFATDVTRRSVDPEGKAFLLAYLGPTTGDNPAVKVRPFCSHLVGKAFPVDQFNKLNNQQLSHPRTSGGGYNCRHSVVPVLDSDSVIKRMGITRGKPEDITKANDAAKKARSRR